MPDAVGAKGESRKRWARLRGPVARAGVVACVAVLALVGAGRLDDAVAIFDFRADLYAGETYVERTYPASEWVAGNANVMEDGRLWMPEDAEYRVMNGRELSIAESSGYGRHFLRTLLLPRIQTDSESASWVFCYGCSQETLGAQYEVLSDSGDGFLFARRR
jgi:hypothetical protein